LRSVFVFSLLTLAILNLTDHSQAFGKGKSSGLDGRLPLAGVIADTKGNLYGTTLLGGDGGGQGQGTVFELTPNGSGGWTESILFSFDNTDGFEPSSRLAMDSDSNGNLLDLYGTTWLGGAPYINGTVFELTPPAKTGGSWTESTLFNFNGPDGTNPRAVTRDNSGNLYGTTQSGGANEDGTVFELVQNKKGNWKESVLLNFAGSSDGQNPRGTLILDGGSIYGTTQTGGTGGAGTVFELTPGTGESWTESVIHSFTGSDGSNPGSLIMDSTGNLYSMTESGGGTANDGTVFELTPPMTIGGTCSNNVGPGCWTETVLHSFSGSDGAAPSAPEAGLIMDTLGNLYGTTFDGGTSSYGTVFELRPPTSVVTTWTETVLHSFSGSPADGEYPVGLIMNGNNLYGTTYEGGAIGGGTVFELSLATGVETVLYSFDGPAL